MKFKKSSLGMAYIVFATTMAGMTSVAGGIALAPLLFIYGRRGRNLLFDWSAWLILFAMLLLLVVFAQDSRSVPNLALSMVCALALSLTARHQIKLDPEFLPRFCTACEVIFWLTLGLSVASTALGLPFSPSYYPWETFGTEYRLLLLTKEQFGHTASLWLTAFALLGRLRRPRILRPLNIAICLVLATSLLLTKTRIGLLILALLGLLCLMRAFRIRAGVAAPLIIISAWGYFFFYFSLQFSDDLRLQVENFLIEVQHEFPNLRIVSASTSSTLLAGRDILNERLLELIIREPWTGNGQSNPILNIAYSTTPFAMVIGGSESPLRIAAKYGIPFAALFILLLFRASWAARRSAGEATLMAIILITAASESTFENLTGVGGLFFFATLLCIEKWRMKPRHLARVLLSSRQTMSPKWVAVK
jgi:hypothetical protein